MPSDGVCVGPHAEWLESNDLKTTSQAAKSDYKVFLRQMAWLAQQCAFAGPPG